MSAAQLPARIRGLQIAIGTAKSVSRLADIRDRLIGLESILRARGERLVEEHALVKLRLIAERRAGALLLSMTPKGKRLANGTLEQHGIGRHHSMQWQCISVVPEPDFHEWCEDQRQAGSPLSTKGLYRLARQYKPARKGRPGPGTAPGMTAAAALETISRLFLDIRRMLADRPHEPVTPERILAAGAAIGVLRAHVRQAGNAAAKGA